VELDGRPLAVDTRKATAILAYVAVSGHVQSRDIIATLLWPEYDGERSRAALRRTLSTLRTSLDGEWLVSDRGTIGLNLEQAWFDLAG
jgi:DNA-binding SARP family transcriptional activator